MQTCNGAGDLSGGLLEINDDAMDRARPAPLAVAGLAEYLMPISFCIGSHSQHEPGNIVLAY